MDKAQADQVAKILNDKGAGRACPRCGSTKLETAGEGTVPNIPPTGEIAVVLVLCTQCGYIAQHAKWVLGLVKSF